MNEALVVVGFLSAATISRREQGKAKDSTAALDTKVRNIALRVVLGRHRKLRGISMI